MRCRRCPTRHGSRRCSRRRRWSSLTSRRSDHGPLRRRHRSRHHPLRALVRRPRRGEGPRRRAADAPDPAAHRARARSRAEAAAALVPLPAARPRSSRRRARAAVGQATRREVVGELARTHGAKVPTRLVSLGEELALPPGRRSPRGDPPVAGARRRCSASRRSRRRARYLEHLREAWDHALARAAPLAEQEVVLTVPASFDAARARAHRSRRRSAPGCGERDAARGAAGRALRVARGAGRALAQAGRGRRRRSSSSTSAAAPATSRSSR